MPDRRHRRAVVRPPRGRGTYGHGIVILGSRPTGAAGGRIPRPPPPRRGPLARRLRRPPSRARRADPRVLPGAGGHGGPQAGRGRSDRLARRSTPGGRHNPAGAARRVSHPPRDRPRRHRRGLRGRPGVTRPAGGPEDPPAPWPRRPRPDRAVPAGVAVGGSAAPRARRAGLRHGRARGGLQLCDAVHPGPRPGRDPGGPAPAPRRRAGGRRGG